MLSLFDLYLDWQLICLGPQCIVVDFVWPFHIYDSTEASASENLYVI